MKLSDRTMKLACLWDGPGYPLRAFLADWVTGRLRKLGL